MNRLLREMTDEQRNAVVVAIVLLAAIGVFMLGRLFR